MQYVFCRVDLFDREIQRRCAGLRHRRTHWDASLRLRVIAPFNDAFELLLLRANEPLHVRLQKKSQEPLQFEKVAHESTAVARMKLMNMTQSLERAANHLIDKAARAINFDNPGGESLTQSKMPPLECQQIAQVECA